MDNSSKNSRSAGKGWGILVVLGGLLAVAGLVSKAIVLTVIGVILALIGTKRKGKAEAARQGACKDKAVEPALKEVFDEVSYQPNERLNEPEIAPMQLLLHTSYQYVDGSDRASATHRGVRVLLGNVRLMETETFRDEQTDLERTNEKEVWQGLMLTCKIGHTLPTAVALAPRGKIDGLLRYADMKTGNDAFDKRFTVKTENPETALLVLTPAMQEKLLAAADASCGALLVTFCADGRVSMAVNAGRNFFLPARSSADENAERVRIAGNLQRLLAVIDEANPVSQEGAAQ